jgi:site-specific recombinase XerD
MAVTIMADNTLAAHLVGFFGTYLPKLRNVSPHTIRSYRDAVLQLLESAAMTKGKGINSLSLEDMGSGTVEAFLLELEGRGVALSTQNQRLAAIHSFFKYVQRRDIALFALCQSVLAIERKKAPEPVVGYLSIQEITMLLALPDVTKASGIRHLAMLSLLYESAARVQELIDIRVGELGIGAKVVTLHGKGGKTRTVPISMETAAILKRYLRVFPQDPGDYLFTGRYGLPISRSGIQYVIDSYVAMGKRNAPGLFAKKITGHIFRHSRSMHLLEAGVNLVYISDLLGHASITTTEVYAKASPETKRREIEKHSKTITPCGKYSNKEMSSLDDWLRGIC